MGTLPHLSSPATLGDQAYTAIRSAIISGALQRGERVTERGLAESMAISPTPVREALRRLEQDRLVERLGPREVRIAKFDENELREVTLIEDALRALSARLAAEKATEEQLGEMRRLLDHADTVREKGAGLEPGSADERELAVAILDDMRRFHGLVDRASANPTLIQMLHMVDAFGADERRRSVLAEVGGDRRGAAETRYEQHRAIFDAIVARDGDLAEDLMRSHSRTSNRSRVTARFSG
ncbi:GntR family transcriptional regulator [Streptomyces sp. NBC_01476]|uniref:GntR family transcriptional regulator n=1 Tax=Streptomyces sp. NBC_01476 TaxID=2903881 RepID=UPI002E3357C9|nr:GntR family transcriptional regulator [Streptomyces sp. NBC_01476]